MASVALGVGVSLVSGLLKGKPPKQKAQPENIIKPTASEAGAAIPIIIGEGRCSSNLIYAYPVRRVVEPGKKRKNQPRDPDEISFYATFGFGLAWGQYNIIAIYSQQELIWSIDTFPGYDAVKSTTTDAYFTFYDGSINQAVEPDYTTLVGAANAAAFRGLSWIAFKDYPLEKSGNAFPTMEIVLENKNKKAGAGEDQVYTDCIFDLALAAGFDNTKIDVDLGSWDAAVKGFAIGQDGESVSTSLVNACSLSDASLYFNSETEILSVRSRSTSSTCHTIGTSIATATVTNYSHDFTGQEADRMHKMYVNNAATYAKGISFKFIDKNRAYDPSSIRANRPSKSGRSEENLSITTSAVTDLTTAFKLSNLAIRTQWQSQVTFEIVIPVNLLLPDSNDGYIKPGDMLEVDVASFYSRNPRTNLSLGKAYISIRTIDVGADDTAVVKGNLVNPAITRWFDSNASVPQNNLPQGSTIDSVTPIPATLLEAPFNRFSTSTDNSVMVMTRATGRDIGSVYFSYNGGSSYVDTTIKIYKPVDHGVLAATITGGTVLNATATFTLNTTVGEFNSVTSTAFTDGQNTFVLSTGEYVGFQTATIVSAGVWQFTGIYRGLHGTGHLATTNILAGTVFYYVDGINPPTTVTVNTALLSLGSSLFCKIVNQQSSLAATTATSITAFQYASNKPYAPGSIAYTSVGTVDTWTWLRRDRKFGTTANGDSPTANAEVTESYKVEVINTFGGGSVLVASATVTSPTYVVDRTALSLTVYRLRVSQNGLTQQGYYGEQNYP